MPEPTVETKNTTCYFCDTEIDKLNLDEVIHCSVRKSDDGGIQWACPECAAVHCQSACEQSSS